MPGSERIPRNYAAHLCGGGVIEPPVWLSKNMVANSDIAMLLPSSRTVKPDQCKIANEWYCSRGCERRRFRENTEFRDMLVLPRHVTNRWRAAHSCTRVIVTISLIAALMCCSATARAADDLYRAQTIVTGQGEANRVVGFATCLQDVLVKVSGAFKLARDTRLAGYKTHARDFVRAFSYHDRMSGTPTRDEQGTRDRPYDLTVDFDATEIGGILTALGVKPWLSHRPVLGVFVEVEQGARSYIVTADARQSDLQREALLAAAHKRGISIALPDTASLAKSNIDAAGLTAVPSSTLAGLAEGGGEAVLVGHLVWNDRQLGWTTTWRMDWQGRPHRWQFGGVTFDEAFRRGIGGAAQILSDNGDPTE